MANRVKTISKYSGSAWGTEVPIGADATNVDMTTAPSDYDSSTSETSKEIIGTDDVKAIASDTDLTAWGKFNRFRKRVSNKFADYFATANLTGSSAGVTSAGDDSHAYTTAALNAYFSTVVGYSSAADVSSVGSVASQLSSLNSNCESLQSNKIDKSVIANNLTTTASGYVLDARQGKTLYDKISRLTYKDYGVVCNNAPGSGQPTYYWGDASLAGDLSDKIYLAATAINCTNGGLALVQLLWSDSNKTIRARSSQSGGTVTVRVLFKYKTT